VLLIGTNTFLFMRLLHLQVVTSSDSLANLAKHAFSTGEKAGCTLSTQTMRNHDCMLGVALLPHCLLVHSCGMLALKAVATKK
jgi:hypothetical protein